MVEAAISTSTNSERLLLGEQVARMPVGARARDRRDMCASVWPEAPAVVPGKPIEFSHRGSQRGPPAPLFPRSI
eukprot:7122233-Lingulodinium_polyedra.AAC.1